MRHHNVSFANFICHFGTSKVLLDLAREVVIPALTDPGLERRYGKETHYVIRDAELVKLVDEPGNRVIGIAGRFIKSTMLRRHQILDPKLGILQSEQSMPSAPSAFFLLILNSHRLVYFGETPYAPDLKTFEVAARKFIKIAYRRHIEELQRRAAAAGDPTTKAALMRIDEPPILNLIPLSNETSVEDFLSRFSRLERIDFELVRPNQEIDGHEVWRQYRNYNQKLAPDKTVVRTERSSGFDLSEAGKQIADASASGNQRVRLVGRDQNDNKLDGDNDSFKVTTTIPNPPVGRSELVNRLYQSFATLVIAGVLRLEAPVEDVKTKIFALDSK